MECQKRDDGRIEVIDPGLPEDARYRVLGFRPLGRPSAWGWTEGECRIAVTTRRPYG